jgi:hypothetical protein
LESFLILLFCSLSLGILSHNVFQQ